MSATEAQTTHEVFVLELSMEQVQAMLSAMAAVNSAPAEATVMGQRTIIDLEPRGPQSLPWGPLQMPSAA